MLGFGWSSQATFRIAESTQEICLRTKSRNLGLVSPDPATIAGWTVDKFCVVVSAALSYTLRKQEQGYHQQFRESRKHQVNRG